jgi:hypothetical protein
MSDPDRLLTTSSVIDRQRPRDVRQYDHRRLSLPPICAVRCGPIGKSIVAALTGSTATGPWGVTFQSVAEGPASRRPFRPCVWRACYSSAISVPTRAHRAMYS